MHDFWEKVEHYNTKLIPPAIVVLFFVIVIELGFKDFAHHYHIPLKIIDGLVIAIFVIDLIFLGIRSKNTRFFFKNYWLDMLAIFPFGIFFTVVTRLYRAALVTQRVIIGQAILHESLEARKGISAAARTGRLARIVRIGARSLRVITKSKLFTGFAHKHHVAKRNLKHIEKKEKEAVRAAKAHAKKKAAKKYPKSKKNSNRKSSKKKR